LADKPPDLSLLVLPVVCTVTLALFTELADFASTANGLVFVLSSRKIAIETKNPSISIMVYLHIHIPYLFIRRNLTPVKSFFHFALLSLVSFRFNLLTTFPEPNYKLWN
jgi:hypothetical protein